jgi:small-conductance mechanosensitive channel
MQPSDFLSAIDSEVVSQLLPLGDSIIGAGVTLLTALFTYLVGRRRSAQEVQNLQAEKESIEAASGVSTASAAQIISEAAAATVSPLLSRIKEQREEIEFLTGKNVDYRNQLDELRTEIAKTAAQNELMRRKFMLQGEIPPELLPPEVK